MLHSNIIHSPIWVSAVVRDYLFKLCYHVKNLRSARTQYIYINIHYILCTSFLVHKILYCTVQKCNDSCISYIYLPAITTFRLQNRLNLFLLINFEHKFNYLGATSRDTPIYACAVHICIYTLIGLRIPVRNGHIIILCIVYIIRRGAS